jgi:hypothetical protein
MLLYHVNFPEANTRTIEDRLKVEERGARMEGTNTHLESTWTKENLTMKTSGPGAFWKYSDSTAKSGLEPG